MSFHACLYTELSSPSSVASSTDYVIGHHNPLFRATEGFSLWPGRGAGGATVAGGESSGTTRVNGGAEVGADNPQTEAQDGRILFYHKPTLANDPAGDIPDAVPVYLGCPGGGMALGLPLNEAWQGGEQQVCTPLPWHPWCRCWRRLD